MTTIDKFAVLIPSFSGLRLVLECIDSNADAPVLIPSFSGLRLVLLDDVEECVLTMS